MKIYFSESSKKKYFKYVDEILSSNRWTEGKMLRLFEEEFEEFSGLHAVGVNSGGAALALLYEYVGVKDRDVIIPANTFWATSAAAKRAGANVIYADCNKEDLCLSYEDLVNRVTANTAAVTVVHIGGHIAFDIKKTAEFCRENGIALIEDCAHAHGAVFNDLSPGSWGIGGAYSFYATKTLPTGEGGILVTADKDLADWAKIQRNYGKKSLNGRIQYESKTGFNYRMSEFIAALGRVQLENLPEVLEWKRELGRKYNSIFENRVRLPSGMKSGFYKYIAFDYDIAEETGKVYAESDQCHHIDGCNLHLPNSEWIAGHHCCPPIYYGWEHAENSIDELYGILSVNKKWTK